MTQAFRRQIAYVATMRGLIAVERYRMRHGRWPARLADVVPEFLARVPTDPLDGKPLKMARTSDGVVVYSVGIFLRARGRRYQQNDSNNSERGKDRTQSHTKSSE